MSYILDALRRSQAERDRGQVPGLNAQPAAVAALPPRRGGPPWRWVAVALLAAVAVAITVLGLRRAVPAGPPEAPAPTAAVAAVAADPTAPTSAVPAAPPPPPPGGQRPPWQAPPTLPVVVSVPSAGVTPQAPEASVAHPPPSPGAGPAAAVPVTPLAALTPEQRRELPPLVLGGSIWSDSALARFVIVNGQVVREGEIAAPGVMIERIGPKAVLLRWRDLRLELPL